MDVDAFFSEGAEDFGGNADVRTHAQADCGDFAHGVVAVDGGCADAVLQFGQDFDGLFVLAARYGEGEIGSAFAATFWMIMSTSILASATAPKI